MLKHLRIAVTALSLTACVVLVTLWVRSYSYWDGLVYGGSDSDCTLHSESGGLRIYYRRNLPYTFETGFESGPADKQWRWHLDFDLSYHEHPGFYMVCFPHWMPALVLAAVAAIPWLRWSKRFSLGTLLIATTLIAVGLGIIVMAK